MKENLKEIYLWQKLYLVSSICRGITLFVNVLPASMTKHLICTK